MGEHEGSTETLAPAMTFLTYIRRMTVSIAALAVSRHAVDPATASVLDQFAASASSRIEDVAAKLGSADRSASAAPVAGVVGDARPADPVVRARLTRLSRQLDTLVSAADELRDLSS
jgi:hypothetical protein